MKKPLLRLVPVLLFLALWQAVSMLGLVDRDLLPSAIDVARALVDLVRTNEIFWDLAVTLFTALSGLVLAIVVGVPLGAGMGISKQVNGFFGPLVKASYSLPKTALVPLFILWLGVGVRTGIFTVMLASLLPIVVYAFHGVQSVPPVMLWSAQSMGTNRREMIWRILLPGAAHDILTGIRIALGFSFVIAISAEMIASNAGIGKLVYAFGGTGAYDYMFAAVIAIVLAAYLADLGFQALSGRLMRWQDPEAGHG
jgi:ABC-type nitrate/sulfonate/bicarbonate transport system permease component